MHPPFWDPYSTLNQHAGEMALQSPETFNQIAKERTERYAL